MEAVLGHHTNFYELLYAFCLFRGDFRSAGQAMLDLALRLSIEHFSADDERAVISLESERDAYLGENKWPSPAAFFARGGWYWSLVNRSPLIIAAPSSLNTQI